MSKHLEAMQFIEEGHSSDSAPIATPASYFRAARERGDVRRRWAGEEALRIVQRIFLPQSAELPRVVVFAGVDHGNGCSQICASVAETLAMRDSTRVCLIEANFRSPALPEMFGTTNHYGLTNALLQQGHISSFTKRVAQEQLWLLSSGSLAADSPNLLNSEHLRNRMEDLRNDFDFVIVDAPPLAPYSDAVVLGQLSDGLVLVIEAESTRREAASAAVETLRSAKIPILAAVLNKHSFHIPAMIKSRL